MTNYEWLLQMGGEERQAWFDAQNVDANDVSTRKGDVRADGVRANDANVAQDSREKLEADASELTADYAASGDVCDALYGGIVGLLDRQAAITEREVLAHPDEQDSREKLEADVRKWCGMYPYQVDMVWGWLNRQAAIMRRECERDREALDYYANRYAEIDEQMVELAAERDALAHDLRDCNRERESLRGTLGVAIDHAHDILQLIDEGMA